RRPRRGPQRAGRGNRGPGVSPREKIILLFHFSFILPCYTLTVPQMRVQNRKEQKRKMKKMSMILVLLAYLLMAGSALALTDTEVETAARAYVPGGASFMRSEIDDGMYELTFRVDATQEKYEIQVN